VRPLFPGAGAGSACFTPKLEGPRPGADWKQGGSGVPREPRVLAKR